MGQHRKEFCIIRGLTVLLVVVQAIKIDYE